MIEIKNLCKSYNGVIALNNVTMDINDDDIFGLIGTNGAGKSTLLRILSGVIKQDSGEIIVDGESVFKIPLPRKNYASYQILICSLRILHHIPCQKYGAQYIRILIKNDLTL